MIYGIGTDITEVGRIAEILPKTNFCKRFFSGKENEYFLKKNYNPQTVAGNFAAKEAFSKALGTGIRGFELKEISVLRDKLGKPYIELSGRMKEVFGEKRIFVSISHSEKYAVAYVVIEEL